MAVRAKLAYFEGNGTNKNKQTKQEKGGSVILISVLSFLSWVEGWCFGHVPKRLTFWKERMRKKEGNLHLGTEMGFGWAGGRTAMHCKGWKGICLSPDSLQNTTYTCCINMLLKHWRCIYFWQKSCYFTRHSDLCFFENIELQLEEKRKAIWQTIAKQTNTHNIGAKQLLYKQRSRKTTSSTFDISTCFHERVFTWLFTLLKRLALLELALKVFPSMFRF